MVNKVTLIGRLGKDPELKTLPSGAVYCRFSLATTESYKDKDGEYKDQTEWHNIIAWRKAAESLQKQLKKGMLVYIEGKLTHQTWQDNEGHTKNMTEVVVSSFKKLQFDGNKQPMLEPQEPGGNFTKSEDSENEPYEDSDDLPF